jgi:hypothetical protein
MRKYRLLDTPEIIIKVIYILVNYSLDEGQGEYYFPNLDELVNKFKTISSEDQGNGFIRKYGGEIIEKTEDTVISD